MSRDKDLPKNTYEISVDQQRDLLRDGAAFGGQEVKERPAKAALLSTHGKNLEFLAASKSPMKRELLLPIAYSPSISALKDLQKISLTDLRLETHHYGSVIVAKTITHPYQSSNIITVVEDESHVCKLSLNYHDPAVKDLIVPLHSTVAIKEPYLQYLGGGDYVIRVDHPSDVIIFRGDDTTMSMMMQLVEQKGSLGSMEWAKAGDTAYLEKKYASAIECYTQAIEAATADDPSSSKSIYRKRAFAELTTKRFTAARDSAIASINGESIDSKAFQCAGRAAYELGSYEESKEYFSKALSFTPKSTIHQQDLARASERLLEQRQGTYDFSKMFKSLMETNIHLDHADFVQSTRVDETSYGGRGLFATESIRAGDLVLVEKAFALPNLYGSYTPEDIIMYNVNNNSVVQRAQPQLFVQLVQKVFNNPNLHEKFWDLYSGLYNSTGKEGELVDGIPVVDVFLVEAIRLRNCFSCPRLSQSTLDSNVTSDIGSLSTGLWRHAAYLNHSCVPNCTRSFIGDMMIIRAVRDIAVNEELTHQYIAPEALYATRQEKFSQNWNFTCSCHFCTGEKSSPDSNHKARMNVVQKLKTQILGVKEGKVNQATIRTVERLTRKLEDLHEANVYGHLPRLLLVHPSIWLTEAYRSCMNPVKTLLWSCEILRNFGFVEPVRDGKLVLEGDGITNSESLNALRYMGQAYRELGMDSLAVMCENEARMRYVVLTGTEIGATEYVAKKVNFCVYK